MSILPFIDSETRILVIHPDDRFHRIYLSQLMQNQVILYTGFSGRELYLDQAQETIFCGDGVLEMDNSFPEIFVVDGCDRLSDDVLDELIPYLLDCDPLLIVLYSRSVPNMLFEEEYLANKVQIILNAEPIDYLKNEEQVVLEVFGFGVGRVRIDGREVDLSQSDLLHELFFFVLENPVVYREHMLAQFWSHLDRTSAIANFHMTRKKLKDLLAIEFLIARDGYYQLNPDIVLHYDVNKYRDALKQVTYDESPSTMKQYQLAYELQHHDFLLETDAEWVSQLRQELRELQSDATFALAQVASSVDAALGLYSQAFHYNPRREDIAQAMMSIYLDDYTPCDAHLVYDVLKENLKAAYNIEPSDPLKELMKLAKAQCSQ